MKYRVIYGFIDGQDEMRAYRAGDAYPRPGYAPDEERVKTLAGSDNVHGRPLIEAVKEETKEKKRTAKTSSDPAIGGATFPK